MKDLKKELKKLSEKQSLIRNGYESFLDKWARETDYGNDVRVAAYVIDKPMYSDYALYLVTGKKELQHGESGSYIDYDDDFYSWDHLAIKKIKEILKALPGAIKKIEEEVKKMNREEINFPEFKEGGKNE